MDRAAKQAERQRIARQKVLDRQAQLDASAAAEAEYNEIIQCLTGAHRVKFSRRDWVALAAEVKESEPRRRDDDEAAALLELANYQPGWLTRMLGREAKIRQELVEKAKVARGRDDLAHAKRVDAVRVQNEKIEEAQRIVGRDPETMVKALEKYSSLNNLPFSVEGLGILFRNGRVISIVNGVDIEDIPVESVMMLKSGKCSIKKMTTSKLYELHRDAICSAAIRVAIEFLSNLHLNDVEVVMLSDVLDRSTGHIVAEPVLYLCANDQVVSNLNLVRAEPVALVERLGGIMDWNRREGFRAIDVSKFDIELT